MGKWSVVVLLALLGGWAGGAVADRHNNFVADCIDARVFRAVDSEGQVRATLGREGLFLFWPGLDSAISVEALEAVPEYMAARLSTSPDKGVTLRFWEKGFKERLVLGVLPPDQAYLVIFGPDGNKRFAVGTDNLGVVVKLMDAAGDTRAGMAYVKKSGPFFILADEQGNTIWSAA